ncbi:formimidoylglutamase [Alteromonas flava]|uniref:formimidoylglutamase n=1 Tax=Alteromonas flava TaxID=2048003 RepID=UPI000C28C8EB|nr:formimidoylglutamase [Alteromonas flava]
MFNWQGRVDSEDGDLGLRWHQKVQQKPDPKIACSTALVGFCCDLGVAANKGRVGAAQGPDSLRGALANLPWHWSANLNDYGNTQADDQLEYAQQRYAQQIKTALDQHDFVLGLGGGHEIAWGSYQGLASSLGSLEQAKIGIINFDAHFDLRRPAPASSSGTPFRQIAEHRAERQQAFHYACLGISRAANTPALFDYANTSGTHYLLDKDCSLTALKNLLTPFLASIDQLYLTICLDAFPAAHAPGVSAPSALGIDPKMVIAILHWIAQQREHLDFTWKLADIAELNPSFDIDNRTAKLAARIAFELFDAVLPID